MPDRLSPQLEAAGCEALLVLAASARDPDAAPFLGPAHVHACIVIARRGDSPWLAYTTPMEAEEADATGLRLLHPEDLDIPRWQREGASEEAVMAGAAAQALLRAGVPTGRLALAGHLGAGVAQAVAASLARDGWQVVSGHGMMRRFRRHKDGIALAEVRRAAQGAMAALRRVAGDLAAAGARPAGLELAGEPLTVGRLRSTIAVTLAGHGLEQPEGNIVAPAEQGATPHTAGDDARRLRAGESLVVDLFPRGILFADCTRTFCVGEPPESLRRAHEEVRRTLAAAHRGARAGSSGWDLQEAACRALAEAGFATPISHPGTTVGYVHGLGHGVGYELHEAPSFRRHAGDEATLAPGDVFTLEPGLYDRSEGYGVRLEDLMALGEDGSAENLTPLPYELDPRAW